MAALCTMVALGCGATSALQKEFRGEDGVRGAAARSLIDEIAQHARVPAIAGVVGVTARGLVGRTLPDGEIWEHVGEVQTLPVIEGGRVAVSGGGTIQILDLRTGVPVWPEPLSARGRQLFAMAHDGEFTLLVLADLEDSRAQQLIVVGPDGKVKHTAQSEPAVGRPTALRGLALVPWNGRYLSVLDLPAGTSLGRLQVGNATTTAVADPRGILLFGNGVLRLEESVTDPPRRPLDLPAKKLPGDPRWPTDGTLLLEPQGFPVAVYAYPSIGPDRLRFAHDTFASTYHRVVLALGSGRGELRWATYFLRDILGGAASAENLTLCLEDGSLWRLAWRDGSRASSGSLATRLRACVVSPDPRPVEVSRPASLPEQVTSTLTDTGPDMAPVHQLLLDELSANPSPEVTGLLVEIARSPRASADLAEQAARRIALRRTGADSLIAALEDGMEFDVTKRPAPLAAIASALFAMNAKEGAAPLARHLVDPRTTMTDQLMLARVLRVLATAEQVPQLAEYFSLYRTAASEPELAQAVLLTAQTLWTVGGDAGRAIVLEAARDPMTHPELRPALERLISGAESPDTPPSGPGGARGAPGTTPSGVVHQTSPPLEDPNSDAPQK